MHLSRDLLRTPVSWRPEPMSFLRSIAYSVAMICDTIPPLLVIRRKVRNGSDIPFAASLAAVNGKAEERDVFS